MSGTRRPRSPTAAVAGLALALAVALLPACGTGASNAVPTDSADSASAATAPTAPTGPAGSVGTAGSAPPNTPAPAIVITPADTVPTSLPPGYALPGAPLRTSTVPPPVPPGECTETTGNVDRLIFQSNVLAINQPQQRYLVYTPPCYRYEPSKRYPVLYLFHGAQTDETQWEQVGVFTAADRMIADGRISPMIIVLPDAIWAMGTYEGEPPLFERLLVGELMPAVEQDYRTANIAARRGIGGISRGGEWALIEGGRHPDLFGVVGAHSAAVGAPSTPNSMLVPLFKTSRSQRLWLDVGTSDGLIVPVETFHQGLLAAGVVHEYHTGAGGHDRQYWGDQTEQYLSFYAAAFAGRATPGGTGQ